MEKRLIAVDDCNRVIGEALFKRSWRYNECADKRQATWKLIDARNCDFGNITELLDLPIANGWGLSQPNLVWQVADW